jgi:hypothetical protein
MHKRIISKTDRLIKGFHVHIDGFSSILQSVQLGLGGYDGKDEAVCRIHSIQGATLSRGFFCADPLPSSPIGHRKLEHLQIKQLLIASIMKKETHGFVQILLGAFQTSKSF